MPAKLPNDFNIGKEFYTSNLDFTKKRGWIQRHIQWKGLHIKWVSDTGSLRHQAVAQDGGGEDVSRSFRAITALFHKKLEDLKSSNGSSHLLESLNTKERKTLKANFERWNEKIQKRNKKIESSLVLRSIDKIMGRISKHRLGRWLLDGRTTLKLKELDLSPLDVEVKKVDFEQPRSPKDPVLTHDGVGGIDKLIQKPASKKDASTEADEDVQSEKSAALSSELLNSFLIQFKESGEALIAQINAGESREAAPAKRTEIVNALKSQVSVFIEQMRNMTSEESRGISSEQLTLLNGRLQEVLIAMEGVVSAVESGEGEGVAALSGSLTDLKNEVRALGDQIGAFMSGEGVATHERETPEGNVHGEERGVHKNGEVVEGGGTGATAPVHDMEKDPSATLLFEALRTSFGIFETRQQTLFEKIEGFISAVESREAAPAELTEIVNALKSQVEALAEQMRNMTSEESRGISSEQLTLLNGRLQEVLIAMEGVVSAVESGEGGDVADLMSLLTDVKVNLQSLENQIATRKDAIPKKGKDVKTQAPDLGHQDASVNTFEGSIDGFPSELPPVPPEVDDGDVDSSPLRDIEEPFDEENPPTTTVSVVNDFKLGEGDLLEALRVNSDDYLSYILEGVEITNAFDNGYIMPKEIELRRRLKGKDSLTDAVRKVVETCCSKSFLSADIVDFRNIHLHASVPFHALKLAELKWLSQDISITKEEKAGGVASYILKDDKGKKIEEELGKRVIKFLEKEKYIDEKKKISRINIAHTIMKRHGFKDQSEIKHVFFTIVDMLRGKEQRVDTQLSRVYKRYQEYGKSIDRKTIMNQLLEARRVMLGYSVGKGEEDPSHVDVVWKGFPKILKQSDQVLVIRSGVKKFLMRKEDKTVRDGEVLSTLDPSQHNGEMFGMQLARPGTVIIGPQSILEKYKEKTFRYGGKSEHTLALVYIEELTEEQKKQYYSLLGVRAPRTVTRK